MLKIDIQVKRFDNIERSSIYVYFTPTSQLQIRTNTM